jgi:hypothetical protein
MDRRPESPTTRAYMLRFWKVGNPDSQATPTWRFSLEDPHTGEKLGFADLDAFVAFLVEELGGASERVDVPHSA